MADVIDASVAIKWFIEEPGRDNALVVLKKFVHNPNFYAVPELFFFELTNIFNRLISKPTSVQIELLEYVLLSGVHRFAMTPELSRLQRKYQHLGLSGYDASYVAVAELLHGKWITFDEKASKKIKNTKLIELLH